jgi:SAM-dependent methyltransferase
MSWRDRVGQARGALASARGGHTAARTLAISDSRSLVRSLFLASLADVGLGPALSRPRSEQELIDLSGCSRPERLRAWLDVGLEVGELRERSGRFAVRGRRARAIADGDVLLTAHYRSMVEYQTGPYASLASLLRSAEDEGRTDLAEHAGTIAEVSLAAAPFIEPFLRAAIAARRPERALDVGCGTGVYSRVLLDADPLVVVEGIDLAADVVADTQARLVAAGYGNRVIVSVGDVRTWMSDSGQPFGVVTLCNNLYYFAAGERVDLFRRLRALLADGGELVVVSLTRPGSIASAHLHLMLSCQDTAAALPEQGEIERALIQAGYEIVESRMLVPTEPFVGVRARVLGS